MRLDPRRLIAVLLVGGVSVGVAGIALDATAQSQPVVRAASEPPLPPRQQPDGPTGDEPVELIVGLERGADVDAAAERVADAADVEVVDEEKALHAVVVETTAEDAAADLADLRAEPSVAYAEVNSRLYASTVAPNDPFAARQANLVGSGLPAAWEVTTGSPDMVVAVVDTGVSAVPELTGALLPGRDFVNDDTNAADDDGHGTMVASLVGANTDNGAGIAGVCWACRILPVKVLDADGGGDLADVAAGIDWAVSQRVDVINLSLGGPDNSQTLQAAVKNAVDHGIVVVAAAGNEGGTAYATTRQYPAALPGVLSVGATDDDDKRYDFSSHGSWVDVAAPGRAWMVGVDGRPQEAFGTSFAAPLVAGAAALLLTAHPGATPAEVERVLTSTSVHPDGSFAHGRVDAAAAVTAVAFTGGARPSARITGPAGRYRTATTTVTFATGARVASVRGVDGGVDLGTDTAAPWTVTWNPDAKGGPRAADGSRTIQAVVTGVNGEQTTVPVWLSLDRTLPRVTGATPAQNSRRRGTVTLTPTGVSDAGGVVNAALYADGRWVGADASAPYAVKVNLSSRNGPVKLQWKVFDRSGNVGLYNRTLIADNAGPTVRITSGPKNGAKVSGTVKVAVAAADPAGVGRVELLVNGKVVATDRAAPYTFGVVVSKYGAKPRVQVRAYDRVGNVRSDAARTWRR